MPSARYQRGAASHSVTIDWLADGRLQATVDGRVYTLSAWASADGGWQIDADGRQHRAFVSADGESRAVILDGATYTLTIAEDANVPQRKRAGGTTSGDPTAQMPGQVRELLVSPGDRVTKGQTLLVLEAMKMELRVTAPTAGIVRRLLVSLGDVVERHQRLLELGDAPTDGD